MPNAREVGSTVKLPEHRLNMLRGYGFSLSHIGQILNVDMTRQSSRGLAIGDKGAIIFYREGGAVCL